jgi:hypothetical protein
MLVRLLLEDAERQAIELRHQGLDRWLVDELHVIADSTTDDVPQTFVMCHRGRKRVVCIDSE